MKIRACRNCGEDFPAEGNVQYCPECRKSRAPGKKHLTICKTCGSAFYAYDGEDKCGACIRKEKAEAREAEKGARPAPMSDHNRKRRRCNECYWGGRIEGIIYCNHYDMVQILQNMGRAEGEPWRRGCPPESGNVRCKAWLSMAEGKKKYGLDREEVRHRGLTHSAVDNGKGTFFDEGKT